MNIRRAFARERVRCGLRRFGPLGLRRDDAGDASGSTKHIGFVQNLVAKESSYEIAMAFAVGGSCNMRGHRLVGHAGATELV
jgi:hypothetical protein